MAETPEPAPLGVLDVWQAALKADRTFAADAAARAAGQARGEQAKALWRPSVVLSATAGRAGSETASNGAQFSAPGFGQSTGVKFSTSVNSGTSTQWAVQARQPLLNAERSAQSEQLSLADQASEAQWRSAQQALKLRAAERYFDVALAEARLRVLQQQAEAVGRSAQEVQDRFRLGDVPVTDTHEAAARLADLQAQVLMAQTDLQVKRVALANLTGMPMAQLKTTVPVQEVSLPPLAALDQWLADAQAGNPGLQLQTLQVRMAEQESAKHTALGAASVDLVAQAGRDRLSGRGDFGDASQHASQRMLGVQLTVPLYTGGWRSARRDETQALLSEAAARQEQARLDVAQQTQAAWLGLTVGASRVKALAAAQRASRERLDATRLGQQVGHRTTLDLLNANNDAAQAELALAQARIDQVLMRLRLAALAGHLDDPEFQTLDHSWRLASQP
jgi:outer membrane protein